MTKTALIAQLANQLNVSKNMAKQAVDSFLDLVTGSLAKGKEVRIQGFGTFKANQRKAREGVNPQKPTQKIKIPAMKVVSFRSSTDFKKSVKGGK